jgi:hypothetical protein
MANGPNTKPIVPQKTGRAVPYLLAMMWQIMPLAMNMDRRITVNVMFVVRGSWFVVRGSWFVVRGSWFVVRGSWFVVRGYCTELFTNGLLMH